MSDSAAPVVYADRLLEPHELERVTGGVVQRAAQVRRLREMGIDFRIAPDGSPLVLISSLHTRSALSPRARPRIEAVKPRPGS